MQQSTSATFLIKIAKVIFSSTLNQEQQEILFWIVLGLIFWDVQRLTEKKNCTLKENKKEMNKN